MKINECDGLLLIKVILSIANQHGNNYVLKKYKGINIIFDDSIRDKNNYSDIFIICEEHELDNISDDKIFFRSEFSSVVDSILRKKKSCVVMTRNGYGIFISPTFITNDMTMFDIVTGGNTSNIDCYLYNDVLGNAAKTFNNLYIKMENNDLVKTLVNDTKRMRK